MQQYIGTVHHIAAGLTDAEAQRLEGAARAFYLRVLILQHETGCSYRMAYAAVEAAMKEQKR